MSDYYGQNWIRKRNPRRLPPSGHSKGRDWGRIIRRQVFLEREKVLFEYRTKIMREFDF